MPVSEFTDILSGDNYIPTSSLLPLLQLIKNTILAEEDTDLTKDLKAGILMRPEFRCNDSVKENNSVKEMMRAATFIDLLWD